MLNGHKSDSPNELFSFSFSLCVFLLPFFDCVMTFSCWFSTYDSSLCSLWLAYLFSVLLFACVISLFWSGPVSSFLCLLLALFGITFFLSLNLTFLHKCFAFVSSLNWASYEYTLINTHIVVSRLMTFIHMNIGSATYKLMLNCSIENALTCTFIPSTFIKFKTNNGLVS